MDKERFFRLLDKQAAGLTSQDENRQISEVFDRMQQRSVSWEMNTREEEAIQGRIKRRINARLSEKERRDRSLFTYWRLAASLLLVLGLGYLLIHHLSGDVSPVYLERSTGERQKARITLQDGSVVYLNTNSAIRFPEEFDQNSRKVVLEGEAFFEVMSEKERPFLVESNGIVTRVLGTSFNIKSAAANVEVMVKTGKVAVFHESVNDEQQLVLSPSQLARVNPLSREMTVEAVDAGEYLTWRAEKIAFDLVPFSEVLARLGIIYNLNIEVTGDPGTECLIKASYSNRNLYAVLSGLTNLVDFSYEKKAPGTLLVHYRGCKQ
jgi:ferric-dicitrate binding protein FerR (iron transport regulator)